MEVNVLIDCCAELGSSLPLLYRNWKFIMKKREYWKFYSKENDIVLELRLYKNKQIYLSIILGDSLKQLTEGLFG